MTRNESPCATLTFAISATLTLEATPAATRQGSAVIPVELVWLNLELLGLAGTASRSDPRVIRMQKAKFRTAAVALRVIAVTAVTQLLSQQPLGDNIRPRHS